jgi:hypothetical protein
VEAPELDASEAEPRRDGDEEEALGMAAGDAGVLEVPTAGAGDGFDGAGAPSGAGRLGVLGGFGALGGRDGGETGGLTRGADGGGGAGGVIRGAEEGGGGGGVAGDGAGGGGSTTRGVVTVVGGTGGVATVVVGAIGIDGVVTVVDGSDGVATVVVGTWSPSAPPAKASAEPKPAATSMKTPTAPADRRPPSHGVRTTWVFRARRRSKRNRSPPSRRAAVR